jgi:ATPase subunit of ABC transporter with duplicated ATPase domains
MLSTSNISLSFGGQKLFDDVNVKFAPGNCYGLIGANGAGKSTFIRILSGELEPNTGNVIITPGERLSVLKQDHFAYDQHSVLQTVMMGNERLYSIMKEKDAIYAKEDFSDEDGIRSGELEEEFAEMNGWEAESDIAIMLSGMGLDNSFLERNMTDLKGSEKVKVLLAQSLFGDPDILLLDEPTNHLDIRAIKWLENFLMNFKNTVIVVSHDRYFLNKVCTHIADLDFKKLTVYAGNYDFWRMSSELAQRLRSDQKKKSDEKARELKAFIQRFSANASKSSQATSRQKMLDKLELSDLPMTTRKYPFIHFDQEREAGKDILRVDSISKTIDGIKILDDVSFVINKGDKVVFLSENDFALNTLFEILAGEQQADSGKVTWGVTTKMAYFPHENTKYFQDGKYNLVDWLRQYSKDQTETYVRGFLGKMLFSGDDALKKTNVLSGGEKVRCMLSKMMLSEPNVVMLDGPTNHLDLESITAVNDGLTRFTGTLLMQSHDHELMQTVGSRIIDINVKIIEDKAFTYEEYLEEKLSKS